jgi:hypothetical protein
VLCASLLRGTESYRTQVFLTKIVRGRLGSTALDHAKLAISVGGHPWEFVSGAIPRLSDLEVFWPWMEGSMPLRWKEG